MNCAAGGSSFCDCDRPDGHNDPHHCACGGEWTGTFGDDTFKVVVWPPGSLERLLAAVDRVNDGDGDEPVRREPSGIWGPGQ